MYREKEFYSKEKAGPKLLIEIDVYTCNIILLWGQFGPRPSSNTTYKQRDVCFLHGASCGRTYLRSTFIGLPFLLSAVPLRGHHNQLFPSKPILCLLFSLTTPITLLFGLPLGLLQFQPHLLLPMFSLSLI